MRTTKPAVMIVTLILLGHPILSVELIDGHNNSKCKDIIEAKVMRVFGAYLKVATSFILDWAIKASGTEKKPE